ncbi:MAG TPA: hypothetical protein VGI75_10735, partial [Pirellulales bacterium]
ALKAIVDALIFAEVFELLLVFHLIEKQVVRFVVLEQFFISHQLADFVQIKLVRNDRLVVILDALNQIVGLANFDLVAKFVAIGVIAIRLAITSKLVQIKLLVTAVIRLAEVAEHATRISAAH